MAWRSRYAMFARGAQAVRRLAAGSYDAVDSDPAYTRLRGDACQRPRADARPVVPVFERLRLAARASAATHAGPAIGEAERDE